MLIKWPCIVILVFDICSGISLNRPKFNSSISWNTNAITVWNGTHVGQQPTGIFINIHDRIYLTDRENNRILIWYNESFILNESISQNLINSWSIFVTDDDEIIVGNGRFIKAKSESILFVNNSCADLFVDIMNSLYCSSPNENRILKLESNKNKAIPVSIVGTGCPGPLSNMLNRPHGIFVDENLNLFVADTDNNRIQCFQPGQIHATTSVGFGASVDFILNKPTDIVLDGDKNLFIVDSANHRIVRSILNIFECIFGCSGISGSSSSQLSHPQMMAFDNNGNIFVTDVDNHRIQKLSLIRNECVCADDGILVTFDDLQGTKAAIPMPYNNINWINGHTIHRDVYGNKSGAYTATVSGNNALFNAKGSPLNMISIDGKLIKLHSAVAAALWHDNLLLTVTGYRSSIIIREQTFTLQVFTPNYIIFDGYLELDAVLFSTSGGTKNPYVPGNGQHFGMDNICLTFI